MFTWIAMCGALMWPTDFTPTITISPEIKGLLIRPFLQKGMRQNEVEQLLGQPDDFIMFFAAEMWEYDRFSLDLFFRDELTMLMRPPNLADSNPLYRLIRAYDRYWNSCSRPNSSNSNARAMGPDLTSKGP